ncbi:MAG: ATP-binding protein, partial [Bacteroidota bacterium]
TAPFHTKTWFRLSVLAALLVLGGVILLEKVRSRERQRRRLEQLRAEEFNRLRKRTAEDFHDEMGNKLTRINVLTDILKLKIRKENHPDSYRDVGQIVEQIKDNVGALYSGSRDIIWSLHPGHDEFWTVVERLREVGSELFSETETAFEFRNEVVEIQPVKISLDFSRNLQMIAKEVFNNALRHAQATQVTLSVEQRDGALALVFSDNGKGFDPAAANGGNGLKNLKNRAERLGAELEIWSEKTGTKIIVSLKIAT